MWQVMNNPSVLFRLRSSKFRRSFYLTQLEKKMIKDYGLLELRKKAENIVKEKLETKPYNDGKQTPFKGPIFKAMHATATCCRKCLFKWHRIPVYKTLSHDDVNFILGLMMRWIRLGLE